jgi:ubiquinone biosynthesis protein COQ9
MRSALLRHAFPLVRTHGFTRHAISLAALSLPNHTEPLSETAVSALFGPGDEARKSLIQAWLDEGIDTMRRPHGEEGGEKHRGSLSVRDALKHRLEWNEPVLDHLPEVRLLWLIICRSKMSI